MAMLIIAFIVGIFIVYTLYSFSEKYFKIETIQVKSLFYYYLVMLPVLIGTYDIMIPATLSLFLIGGTLAAILSIISITYINDKINIYPKNKWKLFISVSYGIAPMSVLLILFCIPGDLANNFLWTLSHQILRFSLLSIFVVIGFEIWSILLKFYQTEK